jgi:hypothetical protein
VTQHNKQQPVATCNQDSSAHLCLKAPAGTQQPAYNTLLPVDAGMLQSNLHSRCCAVSACAAAAVALCSGSYHPVEVLLVSFASKVFYMSDSGLPAMSLLGDCIMFR